MEHAPGNNEQKEAWVISHDDKRCLVAAGQERHSRTMIARTLLQIESMFNSSIVASRYFQVLACSVVMCACSLFSWLCAQPAVQLLLLNTIMQQLYAVCSNEAGLSS